MEDPTAIEQWCDVPGWEGLYRVSDLGRVLSLPRRGVPRPKLLKGTALWSGYPAVTLCGGSDRRLKIRLHVLVITVFRGPVPAGMEVRHVNGDPLDPRLANLTFGTHTENMWDMSDHGRANNANKDFCPQGHPYSPSNTQVLVNRRVKRGGRTLRRCKACFNARRRAARAGEGVDA